MIVSNNDINETWFLLLKFLIEYGRNTAPRGKLVCELDHVTVNVALECAVLTVPERKLNYRFAAAEALWIIEGRNDIFHERMSPFSDDGKTLAGAYGPRLNAQLHYVVNKLLEDRDTRQASATIWTPNPAPSKDVPCTLAVDFKIRDDRLDMHVFMRSSDVWLGLPYDLFSFSCYAMMVAGLFNAWGSRHLVPVDLGHLYLTASSSHLYAINVDDARRVLAVAQTDIPVIAQPAPRELYRGLGAVEWLRECLRLIAKGDRKARWWDQKID